MFSDLREEVLQKSMFYKHPCLGQKRRFIENFIPISKDVFIKQVSKFESPDLLLGPKPACFKTSKV